MRRMSASAAFSAGRERETRLADRHGTGPSAKGMRATSPTGQRQSRGCIPGLALVGIDTGYRPLQRHALPQDGVNGADPAGGMRHGNFSRDVDGGALPWPGAGRSPGPSAARTPPQCPCRADARPVPYAPLSAAPPAAWQSAEGLPEMPAAPVPGPGSERGGQGVLPVTDRPSEPDRAKVRPRPPATGALPKRAGPLQPAETARPGRVPADQARGAPELAAGLSLCFAGRGAAENAGPRRRSAGKDRDPVPVPEAAAGASCPQRTAALAIRYPLRPAACLSARRRRRPSSLGRAEAGLPAVFRSVCETLAPLRPGSAAARRRGPVMNGPSAPPGARPPSFAGACLRHAATAGLARGPLRPMSPRRAWRGLRRRTVRASRRPGQAARPVCIIVDIAAHPRYVQRGIT